MSEIWSISLEQLPTKDIKMYEDEAKALLAEYEAQLKEKRENEESYRATMYLYTTRWSQEYKELGAIERKIALLKHKMKAEEEEDDS